MKGHLLSVLLALFTLFPLFSFDTFPEKTYPQSDVNSFYDLLFPRQEINYKPGTTWDFAASIIMYEYMKFFSQFMNNGGYTPDLPDGSNPPSSVQTGQPPN